MSKPDLFNYSRRQSSIVRVGHLLLGGDNPVRIQSMTNTPARDPNACIRQAKAIYDKGGEIVRLTTQGTIEAKCLGQVKEGLLAMGCDVPLVADVHFNPNVADVAALYADKVRINPGNYVDSARTFRHIEYTDEEYKDELQKLHDRFVILLNLLKENKRALRIGVNHGSLSDRIMSRYGDTPEGMVESCMEFLRICVKEKFLDVVISIKASNPTVMVRTVRLLCDVMQKEGMNFPLHLGVTEAGEGEDGRIKSALGIGALLADGMGDTIRVSLTEAPENEIPVARKILSYVNLRVNHPPIPCLPYDGFDYLRPERRKTHSVGNIGGGQTPVVVSARFAYDSSVDEEALPDYLYVGQELPSKRIPKVQYIVDADLWKESMENVWPAFKKEYLPFLGFCPARMKFLFISINDLDDEVLACLKAHPEVVLLSQSNHLNRIGAQRAVAHTLTRKGITNPIIFIGHYADEQIEDVQIKAAVDMGPLCFDGLLDGIFLFDNNQIQQVKIDSIAFGILQAARLRMTRTEYISCPSCGRTLYDLEETTARIKEATRHLKGLKIGIMGCIVNGPGEMADADYGYVGAGRGRVSLYKGKECIVKNIPQEEAVQRLLELIEQDRPSK